MKSFTTLKSLFTSFSQNTSTANVTLGAQMINDAHRYLLQKYYNNEFSSTALTVASQQAYDLPSNYSKMKTVTITIGVLKWTLQEVLTRREWDEINVFPYYADIPKYYFIYNGKVNIWPIPSTADNTITYNYKIRVPDLAIEDYTTGTVTMTTNSTAVAGAGTAWLSTYLTSSGSAANLSLWLKPTAPKGDNNWYQISTITADTTLTLANVYPSTQTTQALVPYTIGQMPLLLEDFHDLLVYRPLMIYFSSINPDKMKADQFTALYREGEERLAEYSGSKTVDVNLGRRISKLNPNLFPQDIG